MDQQMLDNASEAAVSQRVSRATSPGGTWRDNKAGAVVEVSGVAKEPHSNQDDGDSAIDSKTSRPSRYRPRTFPYQRYLPYPHDDQELPKLKKCIDRLYIAVSAGDFVPGATHWTREIRGWIQLKFDLPREDRAKLARVYYELSLAPGLENGAAERFASIFMTLTKRKHYLHAGEDLYLDWRPLYRELKSLVLPSEKATVLTISGTHSKRSIRTLLKICSFAQLYYDPEEVPHVLEELLPFFSTSTPDTTFAVIGLLNLLLPTTPVAPDSKWQPQHYLPTLFHLWALVNRSKVADQHFIDLFSRLARDSLPGESLEFGEFGVFKEEQASLTFTAILRLLDIPVSQVTSPYSASVDMYIGLAASLERDQRKHPMAHLIARWIVMSLSPACMDVEVSMMSKLEGLIQAVETFFHPSNTGAWTRTLAQLIFYMTDFFIMRWNREQSGEMKTPKERCLNDAVKRRFVLCLRDVTFMGMFSKSGSALSYSVSSLQALAYLEPNLVLPGALQRIYPSMRGLVEVHRTTSAIRALHQLARPMIRTKGFRCHVTSLLGLALPGIDANDLDKTMFTLAYMQSLFYEMPMWDLTGAPKSEDADEDDTPKLDGSVAAQWVTAEIERLEGETVDIEIDYDSELSPEMEEKIVRSSTADFQNFLSSFLDRVFNLLRNLPDAARLKNGSPEENVANTLPATFTPLFASMSPELYDHALNKISEFVSKNVVYQARDAMAFVCSALCKVNPKKALGVLVPILTSAIRTEIDDNDAGSTRTTGSEVLPRDKALVWNISLLSMSIVHTGNAIMEFEEELFSIGRYMIEKCRGIPSTHASNFLHHLLLTLTMTYTVDYSLYEEADLKDGVTPAHWGAIPDPQRLNIKWHYATQREIDFAVRMFKEFATGEIDRLKSLMSDSPAIKRDGSGKEWSDELSRCLVLLRLIISGTSSLFDLFVASEKDSSAAGDDPMNVDDESSSEDAEDTIFSAAEDEDVKPTLRYPTGYQLTANDPNYKTLHDVRLSIGETLHEAHRFLSEKQQDDVTSFNALYTAFRSWFTDVGIERSAHVLDRVTRLLAADIGHFKVSGRRKEYPRPLLVRRANVYHLQRLRHNASPRPKSELDVKLLTDLVESSVSLYTEIRRTAQTAIESTMKVVIGARPILIPPLLEHLSSSIKQNDFPRIKGALYTLLFGNLTKTVGRDWRYTPSVLRSFVDVMDVDKPSVQKIASSASLQVLDMTRHFSRLVILDQEIIEIIAPGRSMDENTLENMIAKRKSMIKKRQDFITKQRNTTSDQLGAIAEGSHWRKEARTAGLVVGLSLRFDGVASEQTVALVIKRAIDDHPSLRQIYNSALIGLFTYIDMRAVASHDYECLLLDKKHIPGFVRQEPDRKDPDFTKKFLARFAQADADFYVDHDYPGWLVWGRTYPSFEASVASTLEYDEIENNVRTQIGKLLNREWFAKYFQYMKQEPKDQNSDRFRMTNIIALTAAFNLVFSNLSVATFEDLKELVKDVYGDGTDKHQHRATAEILGALLSTAVPLEPKQKSEIWEYVFPIIKNIFEEGITPENLSYWSTFVNMVLQSKDPRRSWPLIEWLASFRLNMSSNAAFKESSKIQFLTHAILDQGWHFQLEKPVVEDFMAHLDHPYKGVREVMGQALAYVYRSRYHESFKTVDDLLESEKAASVVGSKPYVPDEEYTATMKEVFERIEKWRKERPAGQQTASSYTSGSKTVLAWLEFNLTSWECTQMIPFFPDYFLEALLHMMDIKEDPELQAHAYSVFRHLGNVPYRAGQEGPFVEALIRIGRNATSWHQRLRIMINIQAIYFRHLFLMTRERQQALFDCIAAMLEDSQLEVRVGAAATLSGMIRCSSVNMRESIVTQLTTHFTEMLKKNPLPRTRTPGTPTPEQNRLTITRHAATLGLGALVQAFPYTSPPPSWVPGVLATLAIKAAGDPGTVGKSAKSIISDFKKTRQDTWHVDVKAFTAEQLEDLEGVLWKSYFA